MGCNTGGNKEEIESCEVSQLNEALAQFFAGLRKENGKEYEPDSLKVMLASLDCYLRNKNYPKFIVSIGQLRLFWHGGIERIRSCRQFTKKNFHPLCDKQVIASRLG